MSNAIIATVVLAAAAGTTVVALLSSRIIIHGRKTRVAGTAARVRLPLLAVVSAGCLAALASPAAAGGTGAISGTVTNNAASPKPLASMCVAALSAPTGSQIGFTTTNASGQYTISSLPTGSYKLKFTDCSGVGYVPQYYKGKQSLATATSVAVTAPATATGINAKMVLGAKITGTVTNNAASPAPLAQVCVHALSAPGMVTSTGITNASGHYTIRALPTGSYKIEFNDCNGTDYVTRYYNNHASYSTANSLSVTAPSVTSGINAKLVLGGRVTGTVTDNAASPAPLADICVSVMTASGSFVTGATTPASGQYSIAGVPAGSKKVVFSDCAGGDYVPQYYDNEPSLAAANAVSVAPGATNAGINAKMVPAGKISGTVTNNASAPLAHVCVDALDATTSTVIDNATTDSKGQYTIGSLPAGSYKVQFIDCGQQGYIAQYYDNQATFAAANPVSVNSAVTITGISAKLAHP